MKDLPVSIIENSNAEVSIQAVIVDGEIYYMLESDGDIKDDFTDYNKALEAYIKLCFEKINN
jgi:hypothetical protein